MSAKEYRDLMEEAEHWARTARSERERERFLQIASTWRWAMVRAEQRAYRQQRAAESAMA